MDTNQMMLLLMFGAAALLLVVYALKNRASGSAEQDDAPATALPVQPMAPVARTASGAPAVEPGIPPEVVAAIAAAIAAMGEGKYTVRSVSRKRVGGSHGAWNVAAIASYTRPF